MPVLVAGIIHLRPVGVETKVIVLEPLCWIVTIFFDLALIHSSNRKTMENWMVCSTVGGRCKVAEGIARIITGIVPFNPWNYFPCAYRKQAVANLGGGVEFDQTFNVGPIGRCHLDGRRIKFSRIVRSCPVEGFRINFLRGR